MVRSLAWEIILNLDPKPCRKHEVFPLFLAGTGAILQAQRDAIRTRWVKAPEQGFEEAQTFLEMLWKEMDDRGFLPNWLEFMTEKGLKLAFF